MHTPISTGTASHSHTTETLPQPPVPRPSAFGKSVGDYRVGRLAMLSVHTCPLAAPGGYKTGGMNVYVAELSREFGRRGIAVDIFTRDQESCTAHRDSLFDPHEPDLPVRVIHLPAGSLETTPPELLVPVLPIFASEVIAFAARESIHYDAIFSHYWLSGLVTQELVAAWHVPTIQMFHTLGMMKDRIAHQPIGTSRDFAEAWIMGQVDRLIAATPAERDQMITLYDAPAESIAIVPPGVDRTLFMPGDRLAARRSIGWPEKRHIILFVGRIEPLKALDTLIESLAAAFTIAPDLRESTTLMVIGGSPDDSEVHEMRALSDRLGIADAVQFPGSQPHSRMPDLYRAADVLAMPSDYESFGMSALEALACGTPVIATQVGGLAYLVQDSINGLHVPPRNVESLAAAIVRLLTDSALRDRLGAQAAIDADEYGWPSIADQILAVLNKIA